MYSGYNVLVTYDGNFVQVVASPLPWLVPSLALLGKLSLAASFAVVYIHSAEIFPTTLRPVSACTCTCC